MTREEFKSAIVPLQQPFYRLARWLMNNDEDAEDISQEIILRLWKMRDRLSGYNNVKAFGLKMTRNLCLDHLKKKSRNSVEFQASHEKGYSIDENRLEASDNLSLVKQLIRQLPESQQLVLQLRGVEELEIDEIAEVTDMTANNVRVVLSRARKKLKEQYEKYQ
jgi:RNA polymerase sigma factor (sigma-70 family)